MAYDQKEDVFELINSSIADLESTLDVQNETKEERNLYDKLDEIFVLIREEREGNISPSIKTVNHPTFKGIRPGNIIVLSGKYKSGKTTFGASIISDLAIKQKLKVGWFSLKVSEYEMDLKFISMNTSTRYGYLRDPRNKNRYGDYRYKEDSFQNAIVKAVRKFNGTQIYVNDCRIKHSQNHQ